MITTIEMNEDLCSFLMKNDQQNHTIFEQMSLLTKLMEDVQLGNTLEPLLLHTLLVRNMQ